jgi:FkbM family methyltransferase
MSKRNSKSSNIPGNLPLRQRVTEITQSKHQIKPRLLVNGFAAIKECRIGLMMYNINDLIGGRGLELYGEAKWADVKLLGQLLHPGDIVVDAGANIGNHTVFYAKKVAPGGMVYSFEPQRITFEILCANLVLNNLLNVIPMHAGAGEVEGQAVVPAVNPNMVQNFGAVSIEGHQSGDMVRVLPIDSLELKSCKLIKVDVEGMELKVLKGAEKTIRACRPFLFVENNDREGSPETVQTILDFGYKCFWQIAPHYNPDNYFRNPENIWAKVAPDSNMICVPQENNIEITGFEPVISPNDNWVDAINRLRANAAPLPQT